jgi:glycerol uptake facilitator-like aquaporin
MRFIFRGFKSFYKPAEEYDMKRYGAEFFGTFWLVLGGCGSTVLALAFPNVGSAGMVCRWP